MSNNLKYRRMPSTRLKKMLRVLFPIVIFITTVNTAEEFFLIRDNIRTGGRSVPFIILFAVWVVLTAAWAVIYYIYRIRVREYEENYGIDDDTITFLSEHDDLTGLFRRHAAIEHLNQLPPDIVYTNLMLDIDSFKEIHDVYGHDFGDRVLADMAGKLKSYAKGDQYFLARYGSDEFLISVFGQYIEPDSEFLNNLLNLIHQPIEIGLANIIPTVSIGIAYSDGGSSGLEILKRADIALNEAKKHGYKYVTVYSAEMGNKMAERFKIKRSVYDAIRQNGFYMVYQPKVRASDQTLIGYEALVRMKNNVYPPSVFIPVAEENGWLRQIGRLTTEKVICQLAKWRDDGCKLYPVSVNFSTVQVRDTEYLSFLLEKLKEYGIPTKYIEIEITESILIDHMDVAIRLIKDFRAAGIRILLDDFGTGYSSLSYLNSIPLDVIKVDKQFVDEYLNDEKKMLLIRDIIQMGHDMGNEIIVEGVESWDQFIHLRDMGVDAIQGYVFSKPLEPDKAIHFVPEAPEQSLKGIVRA